MVNERLTNRARRLKTWAKLAQNDPRKTEAGRHSSTINLALFWENLAPSTQPLGKFPTSSHTFEAPPARHTFAPLGRVAGHRKGQTYLGKRSAKASNTGGETNFDTSPPKRAISLTSLEAMAWCSASAIRKTVSMLSSN